MSIAATTPAILAKTMRGWTSLSNVLAGGADAVVPFIVSWLQVSEAGRVEARAFDGVVVPLKPNSGGEIKRPDAPVSV